MGDNIQFEEDLKSSAGGMFGGFSGNSPKGMTGWLIRHGIVKSEKMGLYILIAFILFNFVLSAIIFFSS